MRYLPVLLFFVVAFAICAETTADDHARQIIAQTTGTFSDNFFKAVVNENRGNLITCPLSAQLVLAMVAYGAGSNNAVEMRTNLQIPGNNELGQSGYQSLIQTLNAAQGVELRLANKIFTSNRFAVKDAYKQLTATKFLSESQEVDFNNPSAAANTINAWCEQQTNNRIRNVITPGSLSSDTKLLLVNAVYFKGQWKDKFDSAQTQDKPFHVDARTTRNLPTMFLEKRFRFADLPELNARLIELPYNGDEFSMVIVLPNEVNGLKKVQDNINERILVERLGRAGSDSLQLFLPKFNIESTLDLQQAVQKLGINVMFQNGADFFGIADSSIKVSKVVQKAFIEVNEEGSEASGITYVQLVPFSAYTPPIVFDVNRPFYYQIRHTNLNVPIFTGVYLGQQ